MINNIQALRAVAAILIVLFHTAGFYVVVHGDNSFLTLFNKIAFFGVDIFFVISGFVITLTTYNKPRTLTASLHFIQNRAARIYLGYWPFLLLMLALYYFFDPAVLHNTRALVKSIFLYSPNTRHMLSVAWTLNYELYFYLLFTLLFFVPQHRLRHCVIFLFFLVLMRCLFVEAKPHSYFEFASSPYLLEFLGGSLIYHYQTRLLEGRNLLVLLLGVIGGISMGATYNYTLGLPRVYSFGVSAFCLVCLFLLFESKKIFSANRYWRKLGDASYTMYLSHMVLLSLFSFSGCRDWLKLQDLLLINVGFVLLITAIIGFSVAFYHYIEAPLYHKLRRT